MEGCGDFWAALSTEYGLAHEDTVVVNVEALPNSYSDHCGLNVEVWDTVVSDTQTLENIYTEVRRKVDRYIGEEVRTVNVVFQCKWEKHRSVAITEITTALFHRDDRIVEPATHLSKTNWGEWKCGRKDCPRHEWNQRKNDVLANARTIYAKVF